MEHSLLDLLERAETDPLARMKLDDAMRTVYDDMPSRHAYVLDSLATDMKGKNSFTLALRNAQSGVTVREAREGVQAQNIQSIAGPTPQDYGSQLLGDFLTDSATDPGAAPDSPDSFDVLTFDKIMKFAKDRPKPPNLAELEDPNALSVLIAGLVASQRPDKAAEILALPLQWRLMQKAEADERSKIEFDALLQQHDQELDLMIKRFDVEERGRAAQADRESREEIARLSQEGQTERTRITEGGRMERAESSAAFKAGVEKTKNSKALVDQLIRTEDDPAVRDFVVRQWEEANGPLDPQLRAAMISEPQTVRTYANEKSRLTNEGLEARNRKWKVEADIAERTVEDEITLVKNDVAISTDRAKQIKFVVEHMGEEYAKKMAMMDAQIENIKKRTANVGKSGLSKGDSLALKWDLDDATADLRELKAELKALEKDKAQARTNYNYYALQDEDGEDAKFWSDQFDEISLQIVGLNRDMRAKEQAIRDAREAMIRAEKESVEPIDPFAVDNELRGKIGK